MGASDYNDIGPGLSLGLGRELLQQSYQQQRAIEKQQNETWAAVAAVVVILIVIVAAHYVAEHRRKIVRAADAALVSGLATGVRAARKARSKRDGLMRRVLAKASETPPSKD